MLLIFWLSVIGLYVFLVLKEQAETPTAPNERLNERHIEIEDVGEISQPLQRDLLEDLIQDFPFKNIEATIKASVISSATGEFELSFKTKEPIEPEELHKTIVNRAEYLGFTVLLEFFDDSIQGYFYPPTWGRYSHLAIFRFTAEFQRLTSRKTGIFLQDAQ